MSQRQFLSTIIWLVAVNLVIKAFFIFGVDMQVQHRVGQSSYGLYFTLLNLCYLFQIINDFGLNLLHNTDTAKHGKVRVERWRQILRLKVMLSLTYSLVVAGVAFALGYGYAWHLLPWLILNNILISFISVFRAGISGTGRYTSEAIISVLDKVLMILLCGTLLLFSTSFQIEWFAWAQTAALIITVAVAWWITRSFIDTTQTIVDVTPADIIFKNTLPFALSNLLMFIYTRSDSILIEKLLPNGAHEVGIYAAGFRLLDAANMLAFLFTPLLIPMYARLFNNRNETLQLIKLSTGMMICMVSCISLAGYWWGWQIMTLCYGDVDAQWVTTFQLLILCHIPIGLMYIFGSYLTAIGQLRAQNRLFIFSVIINLSLNFILIPRLGTIGTAVAALVTQSLTTIGLITLAVYYLKPTIELKQIANVSLYFILLLLAGWVLSNLPITWVMEIGFFLCIGLINAFLFRLLKWDAFRQLLKSYSSDNG